MKEPTDLIWKVFTPLRNLLNVIEPWWQIYGENIMCFVIVSAVVILAGMVVARHAFKP